MRIFVITISIVLCINANGQQDVFSRSSVSTGNWWDSANPWYYGSDIVDRDIPDNSSIRNYVKIGHNNNLTMTTNGAWFTLATLDFQSGSTSARTINKDGSVNSGLSITGGIYNASSATHVINTNIGVDNNSIQFHVNSTGGFNFGDTIYLNANTLNIGGSGSGNFSFGVIHGSGNINKAGSMTATLTAQNSYTGSTTVEAGTLILNRSGGGTIPNGNNVTVSGGTLRISSNQTLNDLTVSSGTLIVDNGVTLTINGSFTGGGTIQNNGSIILVGPSAFPGASTTITAMTNLTINRSGGITLNKEITISGTLTLTSGNLDIGNNRLIIASNNISGGSNSAMIVTSGTGTLRLNPSATGTFNFPIGSGGYSPISFDFTSATFSSANLDVRVLNIKHPNNSSSTDYVNRYWKINQTGISSFNCNVVATYLAGDVRGTEGNLYAGLYSGGAWQLGSTVNTSNKTLTFTSATSFSDISGGEQSVLPVNLTQFNAQFLGKESKVSWQTANELNCDYFQLFRSDNESTKKIFIGQLYGQGTTNEITDYQFIDYNLPMGATVFYYLHQIDFDGKNEWFGPIKLQTASITTVGGFFNSSGNLEISLNENLKEENTHIRLINMAGQLILSKEISGNNVSNLVINSNDIPHGIYILQIQNGVDVWHHKIVK